MTGLKRLPPGYRRFPIVAWVITTCDKKRYYDDGSNRTYPIINVDATHLMARPDDYENVEIDLRSYIGEGKPIVKVIPAHPNTFLIDNIEDEVWTCYEISGVFTDIEFNERVNGGKENDSS